MVLAATAACGGGGGEEGGDSAAATSGGLSGEPLRILYSSGITGLLAPSATAVGRGAEAAVEWINDNGGINGRPVEISTVDNQSDPTRGVTLVQEELNSDTPPDLVIPGVSSNEALAVAPLLARSKVVGIGPGSSPALNDPVKYPYFWAESASQPSILQAVAAKLDEEGAKSVALIAPNDALGAALEGGLKTAFGEYGIETTAVLFEPEAVDISPVFARAAETNPDWIYMDGSGTQAPVILAGRAKAGVEDIPTVAGVVVGSQPLLELAKGTNQLDNVNLMMLPTQSFVPEEERSETMKAFMEYVNEQGPLEVPLSTYAAGFNSVAIWAQAARAVDGEITAEKVKESLENLPEGGTPREGDRLRHVKPYTSESNFFDVEADEFVLSSVTGVEEGMFTIE
jgi:branched-chain amino acid transport system substrate-binding protein